MNNASEPTGTAIVLGGSIAGLLAARVLTDYCSDVIVVERDVFPDGPLTRRGVPQGGLPHILAARGAQIVDQLFHGFLDELVLGGARVWNDGDLSRLSMTFGEHQLLRSGTIPDPESIVVHYATGHSSSGAYVGVCMPSPTCSSLVATTRCG